MTTNQEDAPFGVFRLGYSLFVWGNVVLLAIIMVWVFWTMFVNTPSGTLATERYAAALPTRQVVAEEALTRFDPNACKKTDVAVCTACHLIDGKGNEVCPSLLEIATVADERIADPAYSGAATTARDYIRESIVNPDIYVVAAPEGKNYGTPGDSLMDASVADNVDLEAVIEYLYCAGGGKELAEAEAAAGGASGDEDASGDADDAAADEDGDEAADDAAADEDADAASESEDADGDADSDADADADEEEEGSGESGDEDSSEDEG